MLMHAWRITRKSDAKLRLVVSSIALMLSLSGGGPNISAGTPAIEDLFRFAAVGSTQTVAHGAWDRLLKDYVRPGLDGLSRVDYAALKSGGRETLKAYIRGLEQLDHRRLDRAEQFAFLANLYNAKTLEIVADEYPVKSIKDIALGGDRFAWITAGPWKAKVLKIGGVELSLDDIEHAILRPTFKDARVHYALNCASVGCPNLGTDAFTGAKLNDQLEAAARAYVNSKRGVAVDGERIVISSIYVWYKADFGGSDQGVLDHLRRYAAPALARKLAGISSITDHTYDWRLNDNKTMR
jgi:hypothetical protein